MQKKHFLLKIDLYDPLNAGLEDSIVLAWLGAGSATFPVVPWQHMLPGHRGHDADPAPDDTAPGSE